MGGLLGLLALAAFAGGDAAAPTGSMSPTYVAVRLAPGHTTAQRVAIEHRLAADPRVRSVQYLTRAQQFAAISRWNPAAARAIGPKLRDLICVTPTGTRAADELLDSFDWRQPGVTSFEEGSSGGKKLYPCGYEGAVWFELHG